jgi:predicted site-specific integrase-resolvase
MSYEEGGNTMTIKEVCDMLSISRSTLYRRIKQGLIEPIKPNPSLLNQPLIFRREEVEKLRDVSGLVREG